MGLGNNVYQLLVLCALATSVVPAEGRVQRSGWLGQLVQYYKNEFFEDLANVTPSVDVQAKITRAPPGYNDSAEWDVDSVIRLLYLMHHSPSSRPALVAVRRMLSVSTRRLYVNPAFISKKLSYKLFPSIQKDNYYDSSSESESDDDNSRDSDFDPWRIVNQTIDDDSIIVVSNPVEARLPSAQISARKLREILEARAFAARMMPVTTHFTVPWRSFSSTTPAEKGKDKDGGDDTTPAMTEATGADGGGEGEDKTTGGGGGDDTTGGGGGDDTTDGGGGDVTKDDGGGDDSQTRKKARRHHQGQRIFRPSSFKPPRRLVAIKAKAKRKSLLRKIFKG